MDHIVYLDYKAKELENISNGTKSMIIRGAMGRKMPYGRVNTSDTLYFTENNGDGIIKAKARVKSVFNSEKLSKEASLEIVEDNQPLLQLNKSLQNRFGGKRYLVLIQITDFEKLEAFNFDKSAFKNMDDWLPVGDINSTKI